MQKYPTLVTFSLSLCLMESPYNLLPSNDFSNRIPSLHQPPNPQHSFSHPAKLADFRVRLTFDPGKSRATAI